MAPLTANSHLFCALGTLFWKSYIYGYIYYHPWSVEAQFESLQDKFFLL